VAGRALNGFYCFPQGKLKPRAVIGLSITEVPSAGIGLAVKKVKLALFLISARSIPIGSSNQTNVKWPGKNKKRRVEIASSGYQLRRAR